MNRLSDKTIKTILEKFQQGMSVNSIATGYGVASNGGNGNNSAGGSSGAGGNGFSLMELNNQYV